MADHSKDDVLQLIKKFGAFLTLKISAELKDNYPSIEEMAQAVRHSGVKIESLLSQAKEKALLTQNGANGEKVSGVYVPAGQLKYDEQDGWIITQLYAVLIGCNQLGVHGEYSTQDLEKIFYEAWFEVMLANDCNINEVELKLTLPDGAVHKHIESLKNHPPNQPISLNVGPKFLNWFKSGNIKFELNGTDGDTRKEGLVIYGVLIKPVVKP